MGGELDSAQRKGRQRDQLKMGTKGHLVKTKIKKIRLEWHSGDLFKRMGRSKLLNHGQMIESDPPTFNLTKRRLMQL